MFYMQHPFKMFTSHLQSVWMVFFYFSPGYVKLDKEKIERGETMRENMIK